MTLQLPIKQKLKNKHMNLINKINGRLVFVLLLIIVLESCHCKNKNYLVPDDIKLVYKQGAEVCYKSNLGNSDVFRIDHKIENNSETYYCFWDVGGKSVNEEYIRTFFVNIKTGNTDGILTRSYAFKDNKNLWYNSSSGVSNYSNYYSELIINNTKYNDVYLDTNMIVTGKLKEIYFNLSYGILQYTYKTGEIWTLQR